MKLLTFTPKLVGYEAPDLASCIYDEITLLSSHFDELYVVTDEYSREAWLPSNVKVIEVPSRGLRKLIEKPRVVKNVSGEVDHIYLRTQSIDEVMATLKASKSMDVVVTVPGTWVFLEKGLKTWLLRRLYEKLLNKAKAVVVYGESMLNDVKRVFSKFRGEGKIQVVKNSINLDRYVYNEEAGSRFREKLSLKEDDVMILSIGVLRPLKGFHILLRGFIKIAEEHPRAHLVVAGPQPDEGYKREVEALASSSTVRDRVHVVGPIPNREVPVALSAAKINGLFALTPLAGEGVPRALLEAMAMGLPCIATDVGSVRDYVKHGETGLIAKASIEDVASKLLSLLEDEEDRKTMGERAKAWVQKNCDMKRNMEKIASIIKS